MSRYVKQDYIGSAVAQLPTKILQTEHGIELVVPVTDVIKTIKNAPSINIVRCEECKYGEACSNYYDDGFCSTGERGKLKTIYNDGGVVAKLVCE